MEGSAAGLLFAALLLLLFQGCGLCVARLALPEESGGAALLLGSVCGSVMLHWFPVIFAFFLGFSILAHLCAALLAAACAGACLWFGRVQKASGFSGAFSAFCRRKFLWLIGAVCLFFGFLVWKSFLFEDGKIFSSQATYGDMSMHLSFITSLARQGDFPPDYSLLPGFRLSYPFLGDSVSSSLYLLGAPLKWAYFLPMLLAGAQVFFGLYLFAVRLLESGGKAALAWTLFFFNGGLGFVYFLTGEKSLSDLFYGFYQTPTNLAEKNIRWVNVIVDMMLPQRATLFGWAVLFPALYLLYRAAFEGQKRYFLYSGVLAGLLPMIHTHSFLALALVCGAWLLSALLKGLSKEGWGTKICKLLILVGLPCMSLLRVTLGRLSSQNFLLWVVCGLAAVYVVLLGWLIWGNIRRSGWKAMMGTWGVLLLATCVLALPQLCYWTFRQVGENSMLRGHFGWVICEKEDGYLWFYLKNIGLTAILALGGLLSAKSREFAKCSPTLLIWFVAEFVEFQPNDYDNNKLLYVAFAFLCCAGAEFSFRLLKLLKKKGGLGKALAGAASVLGLCLCVSSAVLTMGREVTAKYELFGDGAIALCGYVEENTAPDAVILTDTRHNNEVAALAGRNIVCGSSSYLYFHGLPYLKNECAVREMYERPGESLDWFRELKVDYILVSDFERSSYRVDEAAIAALFPTVYDDGVRVLYQVTDEKFASRKE